MGTHLYCFRLNAESVLGKQTGRDFFYASSHLLYVTFLLQSADDEGVVVDRTPPFSSSTSMSSPSGHDNHDEILVGVLYDMVRCVAKFVLVVVAGIYDAAVHMEKSAEAWNEKMFTIEELITSVPTERGARMSKNGKRPLDQDRLSVVKGNLFLENEILTGDNFS